ncbi:MAG: zinc transport system substrate-binding protein [Mariniblastus sp.]|jgi:zinc transport system substrate-binding protein
MSMKDSRELAWEQYKRMIGRPLIQKINSFAKLLPSLAIVVLLVGCGQTDLESNGNTNQRPLELTRTIVAVSYPLQYLTQRVAGPEFEVSFPIPADSDPQAWRPDRAAISNMQSADLIIANGTGATYAKWLTIVSLPDSKLRNTASRSLLLKDYIGVEDVSIVHSHGPEGEHSHPTMVARSWLAPAIAKKQAVYIAGELADVYPEHAALFDDNLQSLVVELDGLTSRLNAAVSSVSGILTATPRLKYFSRATGIGYDQHLTWFKNPNVEQAKKDLDSLAKKHPDQSAQVILFDDALPPQELVDVLSAHKLKAIEISLIDRQPATGDFLTALRENIDRFEEAVESLK